MSRKLFIALALTLLAAFFLAAYPVYVIRPFRYQGPRELALALTVVRFRPVLETVLAIIALAAMAFAWTKLRASIWTKTALTLLAVLVFACGVSSRINVYELMFHPLERSEFTSAAQAKLDGAEEVISVRVGNTGRAYPIRIMSYHHIVNDTVGRLPIVATY